MSEQETNPKSVDPEITRKCLYIVLYVFPFQLLVRQWIIETWGGAKPNNCPRTENLGN